MNLQDMKDKGILSKEVVRRMNGTLPGGLADFLDVLLYGMLESNESYLVKKKIFVNRANPDFTPYKGLDDNRLCADTARALREVRDYLEACALREVLK